jgi:hypothetical protein
MNTVWWGEWIYSNQKVSGLSLNDGKYEILEIWKTATDLMGFKKLSTAQCLLVSYYHQI